MVDMSSMHEMHLGGVDLNLLVALDALLTERNVTRAAARIGLSQSAMSHALGRLRDLLGDAVLVRTAGGMVPTARATRIGPAVRRALAEIGSALAGEAPFEPATSRRTFTLAAVDFAELLLLPPLLARLARVAPGVDLWVKSIPEDLGGALAGGVDLVIGSPRAADTGPGVVREALFDERFVCVVRRGHPLVKRRMTLARFVSLPHLLVAPRGTRASFVDEALAAIGQRRRVACATPHFLVAPHVIAGTDMVLTLAERVARTYAAQLPLVLLPPPIELGTFTVSQLWHERSTDDPGHAWLRGLLREVVAGL
jgi:DNA-binding transcriptional LysR family regulator